MRLTLALIVTLFSTLAAAEKIEIFSEAYYGQKPTMTMAFVANRALGRAWVHIISDNSAPDSSLGYDEYDQKLEGLRYDETNRTIVLDRDGKTVECAKWRNGGFFGIDGWRPTGCRFSYKYGTDMQDDGFYIFRRQIVKVYLNVTE
mgnify:FL=1